MRAYFNCQKSDIAGTAIGQDHTGKKEKNCCGIRIITRNESKRIKHFLAFAILSFVFKEMMEIGGKNISKASFFDPIKRSSVKTFPSSNKPLKLKAHNKVIELNEKCNLFA